MTKGKKIKTKNYFRLFRSRPKGQILFLLLTITTTFTIYNLYFLERIFPGIYVSGINIGGLTITEASEKLAKNFPEPEKLTLNYKGQNFDLVLSNLDFGYNFTKSAEAAYNLDRTGNILLDFKNRATAPFRKKGIGLRLKLNEEKLSENLTTIAGIIRENPVSPSVRLVKGKIIVEKGFPGLKLDTKLLKINVLASIAFARHEPLSIMAEVIDPSLTDDEAKILEERAQKLLGKSLVLSFEYQILTYKNNDIFALLSPKGGPNEESVKEFVYQIATEINREPQNSVFIFEEGRVKEFSPSKDGVLVKTSELKDEVIKDLASLEDEEVKSLAIEIPVTKTASKIKTEDVNNLGIKELIGRGSSRYLGSIASRIHNISLASSKFKGVLVAPGEIFSFNDVLGDVSVYTGYKQAYVIKDGKTVLGDGGGVCQVSSTLFRAALAAGLPIVERRAHSYRVGYYEQDSSPGFDATVYAPTTDLKFKNDTPSHILIQATANPKAATLVFEIYGTSDGRVAKTTKPIISDVVAPPPDLYQDDPTLPVGTVKQIDYRAWGSKVTFNYTVERNSETIYQKTFVSNYRPWQAIYLRGVGPTQ